MKTPINPRFFDITGNRFGKLVVTSYAGRSKNRAWFNCKCDCGNLHSARSDRLRSGTTKSCGCLYKEAAAKRVEKMRISIQERTRRENEPRECQSCGHKRQPSYFRHYRSHICRTCRNERYSNYDLEKRTAIYGITVSRYQDILTLQENKCAICKKSFQETHDYIDHDHKNGEVRGVLCQKCNMGIGMFDENLSILVEAINYLSSYKSIQVVCA